MATTITTGLVRMSYVTLTQPRATTPGQEEVYSLVALIPKSDTQTKALVDAAIQEATQNGIASKWGGKTPAMVVTTLHDGDGVKQNGEPYGDECKGFWVLNCKAKKDRKPRVVDANLQDILDPNEIYSGMWGRVNIGFYPYAFQGKKGIGCGLNHVQKLKDDESLGGAPMSVEAAFGAPAAAPAVDPITGLPR